MCFGDIVACFVLLFLLLTPFFMFIDFRRDFIYDVLKKHKDKSHLLRIKSYKKNLIKKEDLMCARNSLVDKLNDIDSKIESINIELCLYNSLYDAISDKKKKGCNKK